MTTADDKRLQDQVNAANNAGAVVDFGDECTRCMDCQQPYAVWFADSDVWNLVMGGPECKSDPGGMLCPRCFALRAETVYALPIWHLRLERVNRVPQADDTPPDTRSEVETLRRWKAEAMQVLGEWDRVFDALGGGRLGESKAAASLDQVQRLTAQHDAQVAAKAWDEGHVSGAMDVTNLQLWNIKPTPNPYRADRIGGDR